LAVWPGDPPLPRAARGRIALVFLAGFALIAAPLFLFREGRAAPYFARTSDHNIQREIAYTHSIFPALSAAADGLQGPWITADPAPRHDLPGRSRLGWILGIPVLAAFLQALVSPRRELSGLLLMHAGAALAATVAGGEAGTPNGARFAYLTTVTAVAAAGGILLLLSAVPGSLRRIASLGAVGLLTISGALGARDALLRWPERPETFDGFHGQDTLIARAAIRWGSFGAVVLEPEMVHSEVTFETIRDYRLDPDLAADGLAVNGGRSRAFRIASARAARDPAERLVETIRDPWGKTWALVLGRKAKT
jgi:hypothetical protein